MMNRYKFIDQDGQHLHTLDGKPLVGCSSVSQVLAKPLTWWSAGLAVKEFGCPDAKVLTKLRKGKATEEERKALHKSIEDLLPVIAGMTTKEYVALLDRAYRAHDTAKDSAASEGTNLHAECEIYIKMRMQQGPDEPPAISDAILAPLQEFEDAEVAEWLWCEAHMYSEKHFLGGISDAGYRRKDGRVGVLDFKRAKDAYLSFFWQCAGYAIQLEDNGGFDRDGNQLFSALNKIDELSVLAFGMKQPRVQTRTDVNECKDNFCHELALYKALAEERE